MERHRRPVSRRPSLENLRGSSAGHPSQRIPMHSMSDHTEALLPDGDQNMSIWPSITPTFPLPGGEQYPLAMKQFVDRAAGSRATTPDLQEIDSQETLAVKLPQRGKFPWLLSVLTVIPIIIPTAVLLVLVRMYRVISDPGLFEIPSHIRPSDCLVKFADTKLVLIASFLNNLMGPLAGWIMSLYAPKVAQALRLGAIGPKANLWQQLNPAQMTLLGGTCQASSWQHIMLFKYGGSRRRRGSKTTIAPALIQASKLLFLLNTLRVAFFVVIFALHFTVSTITFDQIHTVKQELFNPGFYISEPCLEGNVFAGCYPCTWNPQNSNLAAKLRAQYLIQHQVSNFATIHSIDDSNIAPQALAVLTPGLKVVPANIDFRASSIGVSTECTFITPACEMRYMAASPSPDTYKTVFNCSDAFEGILGVAPELADGSTTAGDASVSKLCFKPSATLQLCYFVDPSLRLVYNPVGYDPETLTTSSDFGPLPESELVPVLYQAVAARIPLTDIGDDIEGNNDVFAGEHLYAEFAMRCKITTYDVEYSRLGGTFQNTTSTVSQSGSVLELFHGTQFYDMLSDSQLDVQDMLARISWQSSTGGLRTEWEQLMSLKVLSAIGSVAIPHPAVLQQTRENMLVAKVPLLSLLLLCAVTLLQVALGTLVIVSTYWKHDLELRDQKCGNQMSTAGAIWGTFQQAAVSDLSQGYAPDKSSLTVEDLRRAEASRVIVSDDVADHLQLILVEVTPPNTRRDEGMVNQLADTA